MLVKDPLMITFFTSIGLAASFKMLKQGGPQVFIFLMIASVLVILQDVLAVALSYATGIHPLLGMLAGSITTVSYTHLHLYAQLQEYVNFV